MTIDIEVEYKTAVERFEDAKTLLAESQINEMKTAYMFGWEKKVTDLLKQNFPPSIELAKEIRYLTDKMIEDSQVINDINPITTLALKVFGFEFKKTIKSQLRAFEGQWAKDNLTIFKRDVDIWEVGTLEPTVSLEDIHLDNLAELEAICVEKNKKRLIP